MPNPSCSSLLATAIGPLPTPPPQLVTPWVSWEQSITERTPGVLCGVTTALPASLLPAYSSFGSSAYSWLAAHTTLPFAAGQCGPWDAPGPSGAQHLRGVLVAAWCYSSAHGGGVAPSTTTTWVGATTTWTPQTTAAAGVVQSSDGGRISGILGVVAGLVAVFLAVLV